MTPIVSRPILPPRTRGLLLLSCLLLGISDASWSKTLDQQSLFSREGSPPEMTRVTLSLSIEDLKTFASSRSMQESASSTPSAPKVAARTTPASPSTSNDSGGKSPGTTWAFVLPVLSVSVISWFLKKHGMRCCVDETVVMDDTVPAEIVVQYREETSPDIELQNVSSSKAGNHRGTEDPVQGLCMLNTSDWTDDTTAEDCLLNSMPPDNSMDYSILQG